MMDWLHVLTVSLLLTLTIELAFSCLLGKRGRDLLLVGLVNILTNPAAVFLYLVMTQYTGVNRFVLVLPLEAAVVLTEWLYYRKYAERIYRPFWFSLAANALTYGMGLAMEFMT